MNNIPSIPLVGFIDNLVEWLRLHASFIFNPIRDFINFTVELFIKIFSVFPPLLFIIVVAALAYYLTKKIKGITIFSILSLLLIWNLDYWDDMVITLSIVVTSALLAIIIGIPLGIWTSKSESVEKVIMPLLDFMQTMPAFVYLIPAVSFFGIGMAPGVISSVIFAMPPAVRMTNLGIKEVPSDLVEAADSFGSTPKQKLFELELPMAKPSIMAGINQTLMLTLSMVVVASMIGAPGLGNVIYTSVSRNDVGVGFASGIAIVILAVILDRLTQALSKKNNR
ncbi:ABC transporter permease [Anaerococcus hydrogenalis]|uniref:Glycine/betaine ABC transporter n=2 Tax=Anaerococcus hydrogenalis TaxID=33029 RepID=A0A2N6UKS2_9FIRM|nr:proline/glycine betaine ABC transporter permease [Anaerococcus hydrogenalis]MDK7694408.1 proline/glycine betaine ABC transporter permease [Anaerococcus hydrogenalis]MDK7696186.1 proline/glycine betaine ABC transporter permease [Anaerococcus hydrogenalis]MDK7707435.1 proline/glycine betaine ABC transporter permease [Anaerococcus hydrogenalis]PMC82450.1 glycine/betaine ABC transporter [Anaerococcus hydrogenalis]